MLAVGAGGGVSESQLSSWLFGSFFLNGLITRLLASSGDLAPGRPVGAFHLTGLLMLVLGLSGWVRRAMQAVPMPIVKGMVAGVFLRFGPGLVYAVRDDFWISAPMVVNNAGYAKRTPVQDITPEEFDDIVAINMRSVFLSCQFFAEHMRSNGWGRIVNITSLAGQNGGTVTSAHYAAAKAGATVLSKYFAQQLAGTGVTVNTIAPGPILHGQEAPVAGADRAHREAGAGRPLRRSFRVRGRNSGHERRPVHALSAAILRPFLHSAPEPKLHPVQP